MRVGIITPYLDEPPEVLRRCRRSVEAQTHPDLLHVMVADGRPSAEVDGWDVRHIVLPLTHADFGETPRIAGAASAYCSGCEAIAFLDADNAYAPDHIASLLALQTSTGAEVVTGTRTLLRPDGSQLGVDDESDGLTFCDTNCLLLTAAALPALGACAFKARGDAIIGDRVLWRTLRESGFATAHLARPTVEYTTTFAYHYTRRGEHPPPGSKVIVEHPVTGARWLETYDAFASRGHRPPHALIVAAEISDNEA